MIFARIDLRDFNGEYLSNLLHRSSPDLLQVDVALPGHYWEWGTERTGFEQLSRALEIAYPTIYLRPELRVVSNAGHPNVVECITSLADFLVDRGSSDLLIAAIRGDNLLADLQAILPADSIPKHAKVLSARVEIGGGPFATALAEGAQFVLSSSYDVSAPLIGAAVERGVCGWEDYAELGLLAAASHFDDVKVEVGANRLVELDSAAIERLDRVRALGVVTHADVRADFGQLALVPTNFQTVRPLHVTAESSRSLWTARVVVEAGFHATAIVSGSSETITGHVDRMPTELSKNSLSITEFLPAITEKGGDGTIARLVYHGQSREICQEFVDWLQLSLISSSTAVRLLAPRPAIEQATEVVSVRIPADSVTISVDTRPAHEWM